MHPRARRALQRGLARWDAIRRASLDIQHGDPLAARLGSLGPGSVVQYPYTMTGNSRAVVIGSGTEVRSGFRFEALAPPGATVIRIGDECYLGHDLRLVAVNGITVGDRVGIGHGCTLSDTVHDYKSTDGPPWQADLKIGRPLVVGDHAWIGNNTVIAGGLTIGAGAIVGANCVISRDVPPDTLVGGNPARVWRRRDEHGTWRWVVDPAFLELAPDAAGVEDGSGATDLR